MPTAYCILPVDGKVYFMSSARVIAELCSASTSSSGTSGLSLVTLPDGVVGNYKGSLTTWSGTDDSVIYLIHAKELQLHVWHFGMGSGNWSLEDTICLRKVCSNSGLTSTLVASHDGRAIDVKVYADWHLRDPKCVLVDVGVDMLYMDIKSRTAEIIYTKTPEDVDWNELFPFVMIQPPIFPAIKLSS